MNTPSHFLITVALGKALKRYNPQRGAMALGSVAPDLPLYVLTFGTLFYYTTFEGKTARETAALMFDELYFHNPYWIGLHNVLHSPLSLAILAILVWKTMDATRGWGRWCAWFLAACGLHSIIDILTHYDDGPLLLWPLSESIRFYSPVSYWDPNHYGNIFFPFEIALMLGLSLYLLTDAVRKRLLSKEKTGSDSA